MVRGQKPDPGDVLRPQLVAGAGGPLLISLQVEFGQRPVERPYVLRVGLAITVLDRRLVAGVVQPGREPEAEHVP